MNPENIDNSEKESTSEQMESLDEYEASLSNEIVEELSEYEENLEQVEAIVEDETISDSMKERVLSSIDKISDELQAKFLYRFGGSAMMGGILGLQEYLIQTQQTIIEEGSILGQGNKVAIAGVALYATIKSIQFAADKFKAYGVKREVKKGTVRGAGDAWGYINKEGENAGLNAHDGDLDISHAEQSKLLDEMFSIHDEEEKAPQYTKEGKEQWKTAMKRIRTEASQVLAS